jgi:hypothetical protein
LNNKGQFSIIAALLVSVVLIATVVMTYSMIRNSPTEALPQVQSAIDETNLALKQILGFTIGYYGSVLQVTGNSSYAKMLATNYLQSGLVNVANIHPDWGASFNVPNETIFLSTNWFTNASYSRGGMSVAYNLTRLGLSGITYQASANLSVQVGRAASINQSELIVTVDGKPVVNLGKQNFKFYRYSYSNSTFELIIPSAVRVASANGTYLLSIPSGVDPYSYAVQVVDQRGIMVTVWSFNHYVITLTWNSLYSTLQGETIVMELLQNGTIRWLGQNLQTTQTVPVPPIPVKAIHINQTTINGINREVPFQIEDWNNNYQVPAGLTGNATVLSNRQMIVFLANHNVTKVTIWWDGRDIAKQTSYAYTNRYFKNDDPTHGILTNGILKLDLNNWLTSTVGSSIAKADFMRINGKTPTYGSNLAYIIHHGIVRDVIQQEAEWGGGITNCPNVYSHIVITLPANATYYTYQLRLMFVASKQNRTITDICPIKITASISPLQTENGTSSGFPIMQSGTGTFYNSSSIWQHHWSQFISGTTTGTGIMFTDYANKMLYTFDNSTNKTGALKVDGTAKTIQLLPVTRSSVSFSSAKDVIWYGAVVTFNGTTPIYNNSTKSGLWITVEDPPKLTVITSNLVSITVTSSPSGSGYVKVDGNAITTPYTFTWTTGSNHTLQALSPVNGTGTRYVWINWSDGGAKNHTYTVPSSSTTVTANWQTQYQVTFNYQVSGGGSGYSAPSVNYMSLGSQRSVTASPTATVWADSGSTYTYTNNPLTGSNASQRWYASTGTSGTISSSTTINPTYYHQYYLIVSSSYGSPTGQGWYNAGSLASFGVTTPASGGAGIQYAFTSWSGSGSGSYSGSSSSYSVTMNNAITETASWQTQYYLTVNSLYGMKSGQGWYNSGASATFSINSTTVSGGTGIQYVFTNWIGSGVGSYNGSASSHSVTMNNAITETANWKTQYQVTFDASSNIKGDSSATIVIVAGTGYNYAQLPYTNWYNSSSSLSYSYASAVASSSSPSTTGYVWISLSGLSQTLRSNTFTVSASGTVTATYTAQTFGIDTNCIGYGSELSSGNSPITTTSMTAQANELIMIVITQGNSGSSNIRSFTLSDSFSSHLTYTQRGSTLSSGSNAEAISVYYAVTDSSHTGSFTITVTPSNYNRNFDVLVFGITGANTASPFDSNGALPKTASNTGSSTPTVTGVSTSNANDMLLAFEGQLSSTAQTANSPFQSIASLLRNSNGEGCNVQYEIVTQTQTNINVQFGQSVSNWVMIVDAVQRAW